LSRINKLLIPIIIVLVGIIIMGNVASKYTSKQRNIEENNYIAYRLIEEGNLQRARLLAGHANEIKNNEVSEQLLLISYCFEDEYGVTLEKAEKIKKQSKIIREIVKYCNDANEGIAFQSDLILILDDIGDQIKLSKKRKEMAEAIISAYSMDGYLYFDDIDDLEEKLSKSDNPNALRARIHLANQEGDTLEAEELAIKLVTKDNSFTNKTLLANLVATGRGRSVDKDSDKIDRLNKEIRSKEKSRDDLKDKLYYATGETMLALLQSQIEAREKEINDLYNELNGIPIRRALNYIIGTSSKLGDEGIAYKLQLARFYFLLGEDELAKDNLQTAIVESISSDKMEYMSNEIYRVVKAYEKDINYMDNNDINTLINDLLLALTQNTQYYSYNYRHDGKSFNQFIIEVLNNIHTKLYISKVDTSNYPEVDVYINMSDNQNHKKQLRKSKLNLVEMGKEINNFELIEVEQSQLNICLVLDTSGSMDGSGIDGAKKAIHNFIQSVDREVQIGLVTFESSAYTVCDITPSTGTIAKAVDSLYASGGTNISSGLLAGMEVLDNKEGNNIIVLLSDGADGYDSMYQMDSVIQMLNNKGISVYSIGLAYADMNYLDNISSRTGGKSLFASDSYDLGIIYDTINQYIMNNYILRFKVVGEVEKLTRTVTVSLEDGSYDTKTYTVGVSMDDIELEKDKEPMSNFYQQIGGSSKGGVN